MKILVVGELSERQHEMLRERWAHVPEAELVFVKSEDFYQEPTPTPDRMYFDEATEISQPAWEKLVVCPQEYHLNTYTDLPKREKVMHPWSRRKKR